MDSLFAILDMMRRGQAGALAAVGLGARQTPYRMIASGTHWRLRDYEECAGAGGRSVVIVAAPIKEPCIWDLAPTASPIRQLLDHGLHVYLLEWKPPTAGGGRAGLSHYADEAISQCIATVIERAAGEAPFMLGHSLGGTLAAIFGALHPEAIRGLVLLSTPLSFAPGSSPFRDALVAILPPMLDMNIVPGSLLSHVSAIASPYTFVWSRVVDTAFSLNDLRAVELQARVEHWTLDEVALPGRLVQQIVDQLYRADRFCRGRLQVGERTIGPADLNAPLLAVVNTADEVATPASMAPFVEIAATQDRRLIEYPGESGVGLQHVAVLVGPKAQATVWPQVLAWLDAHT